MEFKDLFKHGINGKVVYCEDEQSYHLETESMDYGISSEGFWQEWEGKRVRLAIYVLEDN